MSKTVLIIDDDLSLLEMYKLILLNEGYTIKTAIKPDIDSIFQDPPNLIILDLSLIGAEGGDVCSLLKNSIQTKDIPVVVVSAKSLQEVRNAATRYGANGFLLKPFDVDVLSGTVKKYLS